MDGAVNDGFCSNIKDIVQNTSGPHIDNVYVTNSSNFHIGNKIIVHGPVHVCGDDIKTEFNNGTFEIPDKEEKDKVVRWISKSVQNNKILVLVVSILAMFIVSLILFMVLYSPGANLAPNTAITDIGKTKYESTNSTSKMVSRMEWVAQPSKVPLDKLLLPVPLVVISHTATDTCSERQDCVLIVRYVQTFHMSSLKFDDIAYNFMVGGDGYVYVGRGWDIQGAHTKYYNIRSIGIAFIGTFINVKPTLIQINSVKRLIEEGVKMGKIADDYTLLAHGNLSSTESPGADVYNEIKTWAHFSEIPPS